MGDEHLTDLGNTQRLVRLHGGDLRYVHPWRRWMAWDGQRWAPDASGEVYRRARDVPRELYEQAALAPDSNERKALAAFATKTEAASRLRASVELAESEPGIPAQPEAFDADPWTLNTPKGLLDLRTGEIRQHERDAMCSKIAGAAPDGRSSLWERCVETWFPDPDVRAFMQRAVGYSLIGNVTEAVLLVLHGTGANGKSRFVGAVSGAFGDYATDTPAETLLANRQTGVPNDVARLQGARLVTASESGEGRRLAEAKIKAMTGGDAITARFMRGEWFTFAPSFTPWLSTNHRPIVTGTDLGIWRRIRLVPFDVVIPESERDGRLEEKLAAELPGVMAWAVEGCLEYQRVGLAAPSAVTAATEEYRRESDVIAAFLEERCEIGRDRFATTRALYESYREWAQEAGERVMTKTAFGQAMTERGFDKAKSAGQRGWVGIAIGWTREG